MASTLWERLRIWNPWWDQDRVPPELKGSIERKLAKESTTRPLVVAGPRRAGKSTLLHQIADREGKKRGWENVLFVSMVDAYLRGIPPAEVVEAYIKKLHPAEPIILVDEVQLNEEWILFIREMVDRKEPISFVITGSTSYFLRSKAATLLGGRAELKTLYPLSYEEMASSERGLTGRMKREGVGEHYMEFGAYPEVFLAGLQEKERILSLYAHTIASEDIAATHNLPLDVAWDFLHFLASSLPSKLSVNAVRKKFHFSYDRAEKVVNAFLDSFILLRVPLYAKKPALAHISPWKAYLVDNGLRKAMGQRREPGKELEHVVLQELLKAGVEVRYYQGKRECDFIVMRGSTPVYALQVTVKPDEKREVEGLEEAKRALHIGGEIVSPSNLLEFLESLPKKVEEWKGSF